MTSLPRKPNPKPARERMQARRERLRAQGLRPVQHWVPDLRDPRVLAKIRQDGKRMAQHPENDEIDAFVEGVYDWNELPPYDWGEAS